MRILSHRLLTSDYRQPILFARRIKTVKFTVSRIYECVPLHSISIIKFLDVNRHGSK